MIYVGIDIAKLNHFASAISSDGEELIKPFKFTNDNDLKSSDMHLLMQLTMLLKTMPPSRLTTKPRWLKAGLTIMPLDTVPASSSGSSGK